ncbi:MAG: hypothetical protein K6G89_02555 [Clostridia bacterium]|nr:hypothetical protein [Clostridia bacterium]
MKLICEYCDSYVEVNENAVCPCCHAPLGQTVRAEQLRIQKENEIALQRQAELEKQRLEAQKRQQNMQLIGTIVSGVASGIIGFASGSKMGSLKGPGSGTLSKIGGSILKSLFKG